MTTTVYNIGNLLSVSILWMGGRFGRLYGFHQTADLHDAQCVQDDEDDGDHEQRVDNIARAWNARVDGRAEVSEQP